MINMTVVCAASAAARVAVGILVGEWKNAFANMGFGGGFAHQHAVLTPFGGQRGGRMPVSMAQISRFSWRKRPFTLPILFSDSVANLVKQVGKPLNFEVLISLSCHNCPDVVQALKQFALLNPNISSEMLNGGLFRE